jgi:hypothetical protein
MIEPDDQFIIITIIILLMIKSSKVVRPVPIGPVKLLLHL